MDNIFKIRIFSNRLFSIKYAIGQLKLNIQVIDILKIPGPNSEEPDIEVTLKLLSDDLSEIFYMADRARKEPSEINVF